MIVWDSCLYVTDAKSLGSLIDYSINHWYIDTQTIASITRQWNVMYARPITAAFLLTWDISDVDVLDVIIVRVRRESPVIHNDDTLSIHQ